MSISFFSGYLACMALAALYSRLSLQGTVLEDIVSSFRAKDRYDYPFKIFRFPKLSFFPVIQSIVCSDVIWPSSHHLWECGA